MKTYSFRVGALCAVTLILVAFSSTPVTGTMTDRGPSTVADSVNNARVNPTLLSAFHFRMIGPSRGGRVTAVTGHADLPGTFYFGSTGGGVWKSTDYGTSWFNVSDGYFRTASIGSIDVADSDPNVIYVGTGSDGIRSNVIIGRGVYKSTDAGRTWSFLGLENTGQIGAVVVHPTNPEVVYVAALGSPFGPNTERGVYRTTDGGATWKHVLFVSEQTGAIDLELNPANPDEIYAAMWRAERKPWTIISGAATEDGIYRSTDGGATWTQMHTGLPDGLVGKIDLTVSPADPSRLYALVETRTEKEGLYRSNDHGLTWHMVSNERGLMNRPFYYTNVDADPTNADVVYVNNEGFYRSVDAGENFERISSPHGDNHDMWINPDDPDVFIQSNDGGANVTRDGGITWSTQRNQPTAELYQIHVDDRFPYWVYAGQQDNSTIAVPSLPTRGRIAGAIADWESVGGCETGPAVPRPGDANIVYSNCKGRFGRFNRRTGQEQQYYVGAVNLYGRNPADLPYRFQRVVPVTVSPHNPDVIYHGSQYVHRTIDEGKTWDRISPDLTANRKERQVISGGPITRDITGEEHYSTLYVIEESPLEAGVIWTGANDGPVHVSRDNGATWTDVTPNDMPPEGRIQSIEPSPHNPAKAYIAGYRYLLNDFHPYIYRTADYGKTWTLLTDGTNGVPIDTPTRVVREDPNREGLLYAGTEFGLYVSFDDGAHWQSFQANLPITPVTDLRIHRKDLIVSTMGRSFWILDDLSPLYEMDASFETDAIRFFAPRNAWRMRYSSFRRSTADPEYLPAGALFDYFLPEDTPEQVELKITDARGRLVRSYRSPAESTSEATTSSTVSSTPSARPGGGNTHPALTRLSAASGMHRFLWDLRHEGALEKTGKHGRGPLAVPGKYSAVLRIGETTAARTFILRPDPRVTADGVTGDDMQAQLAFNLRLRDTISDAWNSVSRIDSMRSILNKDVDNGLEPAVSLDNIFEKLRAELVTDRSDSYPPPMLNDQLSYLMGMTSRADQRPGKDAYDRFDELRSELDALMSRLDAVSVSFGEYRSEREAAK